jgi:uncharacterized protein YndB with AHSA1/START domain/DNA-binding transcriptional ArsR family regulator
MFSASLQRASDPSGREERERNASQKKADLDPYANRSRLTASTRTELSKGPKPSNGRAGSRAVLESSHPSSPGLRKAEPLDASVQLPAGETKQPGGLGLVPAGLDQDLLPKAYLTGDQMVTYYHGMDDVFRALADPTRRSLLDELFKQDGQTLSALQRRLPMTRFGVMKHLRILEEAGLVVTRRRGREKLHFLNPVPIRLVHDRWVSKYAEPWAATLSGLKHRLEDKTMEKVFEIYIKTTPERLWQAITDPEQRSKYNFGASIISDWKPGSRFKIGARDGTVVLGEGENLEVDPPRRLVQSMVALWSDEVKSEGTSRITWEIEQVEDSCRLTVTHDQLREGANPQLYGGWPMLLSGLKTLLETGETLTTPGSLRYSQAPRDLKRTGAKAKELINRLPAARST